MNNEDSPSNLRAPALAVLHRPALCLLLGFCVISYHGAPGAATGPTLQLFPTTVLEDIKETGLVAQELEPDLQDVIARMDQQQSLYLESKCDGADNDPGCQNICVKGPSRNALKPPSRRPPARRSSDFDGAGCRYQQALAPYGRAAAHVHQATPP